MNQLCPPPLLLSISERQRLESIVNSQQCTSTQQDQAQILLLTADGLTKAQIIKAIPVSMNAVRKGRRLYRLNGLKGIAPDFRAGDQSTSASEQKTSQQPSSKKPGITHTKPETSTASRQPVQFSIAGFYLDAPDCAIVLVKSTCAKETNLPDRPSSLSPQTLPEAHNSIVEPMTKSLDLAKSLNHKRSFKLARRKNFLKYLDQLASQQDADTEIHVIVDNDRALMPNEVKNWFLKHANWQVNYTKNSVSFVDFLQEILHQLDDPQAYPQACASCSCLTEALNAHSETNAGSGQPFCWFIEDENEQISSRNDAPHPADAEPNIVAKDPVEPVESVPQPTESSTREQSVQRAKSLISRLDKLSDQSSQGRPSNSQAIGHELALDTADPTLGDQPTPRQSAAKSDENKQPPSLETDVIKAGQTAIESKADVCRDEAEAEAKAETKATATAKAKAKDAKNSNALDSRGSSSKKRTKAKDTSKRASAGGGNGNSSNLHQRSGDDDFRMALTKAMSGFRRSVVTIAIFSVAVNVLILAIPIYLFQVSDRVLTSRSLDTLIMLSVVVVGALAVHVLLDMMRRILLMRAGVRMQTLLGAPVLSAAVKASHVGSNKDFQTLADLEQLRNFISGSVMITFFDAPLAPLFFVGVFLIHPHLGYILCASAGLVFVVAMINQKLTAVPYAKASGFGMRANLQADAMSRNALVINAMGMIREGVNLWGRETAESLKAHVSAQDRNIYMAGLSKFIRLTTQIAMLGWGAFLAIGGELTGGMIIAASIIGSRALAPVIGTIEGWRSFVQARNGYGRIKSLLQSSPLNFERLRLPRPSGKLNVDRVLFVPPTTKKVILNGISFSLDPGESLAIVGPSGTGKTTLARMLVGSIAPTAGNVRLDKMDIRNWDPRQFGESVGYLPQDVELFPASIKANIARMRDDVSDESIFEAAEIAGVHDMISQLPQGYETIINVDGTPLSGGQKQRIGLARAFFGAPRLVVLDEPNSNLDSPGEQALAAALERAKTHEITVVAVTQRPSLLKNVDKIMVLDEGRIQKLGHREEVLLQLAGSKKAA